MKLAVLMAGDKDGDGAELDAAKDLLRAVKAGDAKAVSLALTRHYEACKEKAEETDDDEDEDDDHGEY